MTEKLNKMSELSELSELKAELEKNEKTVDRWKGHRLETIMNRTAKLQPVHGNAFYKIISQFEGGFGIDDLREKIDAQMPNLWKLFPPPKNETEWTEYFNDLLADCAAEQCVTVREVWQIIGYDTAEFESMRGRGFSFVQAFLELYMNESEEQMHEREKDLSLEQSKERSEHRTDAWREGSKIIPHIRPDIVEYELERDWPLK